MRARGITFHHVGEILSKIFSVKKMTHIESYLYERAETSRTRAERAIKKEKGRMERVGTRDIEGKATRVGASESGGERVSIKN